jgi:hypothetical protein
MRYHTFDLTVSAAGTPHEYLLTAQSSTQGEASGRSTIDASAGPLAELLAQLESKRLSLTAVPSGSEPRNLSAAPFDREKSPPI